MEVWVKKFTLAQRFGAKAKQCISKKEEESKAKRNKVILSDWL